MKNKNINVRLENEIYKQVEDIADKYNKSLSEIVRLAINSELNKLGSKQSMTKEEYNYLIENLKGVSQRIAKSENQIIGIARNVNQLTKYTNQVKDSRGIDKNYLLLEKYLKILNKIQTELKEISSKAWGRM